MRTGGLLHAELGARIARLGHTDTFAIADRGLPVPPDTPFVDLALVAGVPAFRQVLDAVLAEVTVEAATVAEEAGRPGDGPDPRGPRDWVEGRLPGIVDAIPHEELKRRLDHCRFVVRTGEQTPFANVILRSGVPF